MWHSRQRDDARTVGVMAAGLVVVAMLSACHHEPAHVIPGGDADKGKAAMVTYGCGACHTIPGVTGAHGTVGPPLYFWSRRSIIAGRISNTPTNLIRWIQVPQSIEPGTDMPNLGVSDADARNIAAYLYELH